MKIDLQTVLIAAAVLGAGALVLLPRRQAAAAPAAPLQATGAGAAFANMSLGSYSASNVADLLPSARWAGINVYAQPYVPGLGSFL